MASVIMRNLVIHMMMGKKLSGDTVTSDDTKRFCSRVKICEPLKLEEAINQLMEQMTGGPEGDRAMLSYLSCDRKDFAAELRNAAEYGCMDRMIVY